MRSRSAAALFGAALKELAQIALMREPVVTSTTATAIAFDPALDRQDSSDEGE
ncbi:hypothetical protein NDI48_31835 [Microcoleus sp. AS-A8]